MDGFEHFSDTRPYTDRTPFPAAALLLIEDGGVGRDCLRLVLAQRLAGWRIDTADNAQEIADGPEPRVDLILCSGGRFDPEDITALTAVAPVLVCADDDPHGGQRYLRAGAGGFVPASLGLGALLAAIERVRAGGRYVPVTPAPARSSTDPAPVWHELTRRQREVLALITEGKSNKLIADALTMSEDTVKAHVKQIIRRLNVANRTQAALLATRAEPLAGRREAAAR